MGRFLMMSAALAAILGCGKMDSAQLAEKVKGEMLRDLVKDEAYAGLTLERVTLVQKGQSNDYAGIAKGAVGDIPVSFDVTCQYDGVSMIWKATLQDAFAFRNRKMAQGVSRSASSAWNSTKKTVGSGYDKAAAAAGEATAALKKGSEKVAEKTSEIYHEVRRKAVEVME